MKNEQREKIGRYADLAMKICTALFLAVTLILTFTVSDYYIFNRIAFSDGEDKFNVFFVLSQWFKKAGILLLPLAVFYKKRSCADIAKYFLPAFIIISCFTFGSFFDVTLIREDSTAETIILANINEFIPKAANIALFFIANALELTVCALLFVRDGYKASAKSFIYLPFAVLAVIPLNLFENFFDINAIPQNSFLRFRNFTVWHFLALAALAGFTIGAYYFLRKKDRATQDGYLVATAIILLIQYHSKDSMLLGDGYNVYKTVYAVIPLFICNLGVYVASVSVIMKKRVLYAISFFVHAVGALTVFVYFGKDEMSNYGIFCSYSILYFCLTHCLLFALCVMPTALGHYKFRIKDCIIPLIYYCIVIILAAITSGLVTTALMNCTYNGEHLPDKWFKPNYAFTQVNPLPIEVPVIPLVIGECELNLLYLILLYLAYVALFWAFTGAYYAFLAIRKRVLARGREEEIPQVAIPLVSAEETAVTEAYSGVDGEKEEKVEEKIE